MGHRRLRTLSRWLSFALRPQKPFGLLGTGDEGMRTQAHLLVHTAPELCIPAKGLFLPGLQQDVG